MVERVQYEDAGARRVHEQYRQVLITQVREGVRRLGFDFFDKYINNNLTPETLFAFSDPTGRPIWRFKIISLSATNTGRPSVKRESTIDGTVSEVLVDDLFKPNIVEVKDVK